MNPAAINAVSVICFPKGGHVVYIRSLTKCTSPSLRVGVLCARGAAFERLRASRIIDDLYVSELLQETALQFVTSPAWSRHLRRLRVQLLERRDAMVQAVNKHFGQGSLSHVPVGGLHLWIKLADDISDVMLAKEAADAHVGIMPGRVWFPAEPTGEYIRLTFGAEDPGTITSAVTKRAYRSGRQAKSLTQC